MRTAKLQLNISRRSGKIVFEMENISQAVTVKTLIRDTSTTILSGDIIPIVGPKGCRDTMLIKLLLGEIQPTSAQICYGTKLEITYYVQNHTDLDLEKTVMDNL